MNAKIIILNIACLCIFSSCVKDIKDIDNLSRYPSEKVWKDPKLIDAYLTDLYYSALPKGWPVWTANSGKHTDEASGEMLDGYVTVANGRFFTWDYGTIRKINILLEEIETSTIEKDKKEFAKAQGHFLRAFVYFSIIRMHGGFPIIKKPQSQTDPGIYVTRNTTKECFDFIISDLDLAIQGLKDRSKGDDFGRIDKTIAKAFKGRVLLTKASPMFGAKASQHWDAAYTATKEAKEFADKQGFGLLESYAEIFSSNEKNKEAIFSVIFSDPNRLNGRQEHCVRPLSESEDCSNGDNPILGLVDAYPMKDGSKFDPKKNLQTFWKDRDDRFYATIVYNGRVYETGGKRDRRQYTDTLADGNDAFKRNNTGRGSSSSFYCLKGMQPELTKAQARQNSRDWIEIRYAEVLLNFAEAANETGKSEEARKALRDIRKRAGIQAGSDGNYGMKLSGKEDIRQAIKDERYVEFAFEGKRFHDLRRWKDYHKLLNGYKKYGLLSGLKKGKNTDDRNKNALLPEDFTYEKEGIGNTAPMVVPEKYYFFPIAQDELNRNKNLKQNTGWESGTFNPEL